LIREILCHFLIAILKSNYGILTNIPTLDLLKMLNKFGHLPTLASGVEIDSYSRSAKPAILWMVQMGKTFE